MEQVSICITAFNESKNINKLNTSLQELLTKHPRITEIVIANNASEDNTLDMLFQINIPCELRIVNVETNLGYGSGIKAAINAASNNVICILHADDQYSTSDISKVLSTFFQSKIPKNLMVKGKRTLRKDPISVRLLSFANSTIVSFFARKKIVDVNGIPKIFDKTCLPQSLDSFPNNAAFDGALCVYWARTNGEFFEQPVNYIDRSIGKASWSNQKLRVGIQMYLQIQKFQKTKVWK